MHDCACRAVGRKGTEHGFYRHGQRCKLTTQRALLSSVVQLGIKASLSYCNFSFVSFITMEYIEEGLTLILIKEIDYLQSNNSSLLDWKLFTDRRRNPKSLCDLLELLTTIV